MDRTTLLMVMMVMVMMMMMMMRMMVMMVMMVMATMVMMVMMMVMVMVMSDRSESNGWESESGWLSGVQKIYVSHARTSKFRVLNKILGHHALHTTCCVFSAITAQKRQVTCSSAPSQRKKNQATSKKNTIGDGSSDDHC